MDVSHHACHLTSHGDWIPIKGWLDGWVWDGEHVVHHPCIYSLEDFIAFPFILKFAPFIVKQKTLNRNILIKSILNLYKK